jgi:hypothetical protein
MSSQISNLATSLTAPLYTPIICRAKTRVTSFFYVSCCSPTRTPTLSRKASYLRHGHSSGPTTRPRQHSGLLYTMHLHGHGCNHIPSRVPARLRPTRTTVGQPLYTVRPPSTGTASVTGPGSAQADWDPKTSLSRPLALTWNWSTVLTPIGSHPPTSWMPMVTTSELDPFQKTGEQVPVPQVLRCPTTTPRRAPRAPWKAQDVSHIMAPAVCISNPSNGTHNCQPGWRTCLDSTMDVIIQPPAAAYRSTPALAQNLRAAPRRRKSISLPVGTAGWLWNLRLDRCGQALNPSNRL